MQLDKGYNRFFTSQLNKMVLQLNAFGLSVLTKHKWVNKIRKYRNNNVQCAKKGLETNKIKIEKQETASIVTIHSSSNTNISRVSFAKQT